MRTLLVPPPLQSGSMQISDREAHHALHVLRLQPGDQVRLCDGAGRVATATVRDCSRHHLTCDAGVVTEQPAPAAARLELLVATPRSNRFEDMLRSLTELGVGAIRPLRTERSQRDPNLERAERVAGEALKQCGRSHLPELGPVVEFSTLSFDPERHILLDAQGPSLAGAASRARSLIIGPEGGLSPEEREHLISQGVKAYCLGPHILRIETAAVAAAAVCIAAWESD